MRTTLPAALFALTLLSACATENEIIEHSWTYESQVWMAEEEVVEPEPARFYLLDIPYGPAVSDEGHVLLFDWQTGGDVYRWTEEEGLEWVTTTGAYFNSVHDISADGQTIIGSYGNYLIEEDTQAAVWTEADGWQKLGALAGAGDCPMQTSGWSLDATGSHAVGLAFGPRDLDNPDPSDVGCSAYAFRWDANGGLVPLEQLANGGNRASAVSRNGELTVGFAQGDSNRTPAVWYADGSGEVLNPAWSGEFYGVSNDGTMAVGFLGSKAISWTPDDGHRFLGILGAPGQSSSEAYTVCGPNNELILGKDSLSGGVAWAWTEQTGAVNLKEYLEGLGVELPPQTRLSSALACSPDKRFLVGSGSVGDESGTWVAVIPAHFYDPAN